MPATEDFVRPLPKMHRVFAVSMIVLFVATLLMMYFDHHDEWRGYQRQFFRIEADKVEAEEQARIAGVGGDKGYSDKLKELKDASVQRKTELVQTVTNLADLEAEAKALDNEYGMQMRKVREKRAFRDVARANYDLGIRDQLDGDQIAELHLKFKELQGEVEGLEGELDVRDATRNKAVVNLKEKTKEFDAAKGEIKAFEADMVRLEAVKNKIAPSDPLRSFKRWLMEQPIVDGFNSHMKIQQDWLPDMKITLGMAKTARYDRCRTCHLGIERVGPGDVPDFPHGDGTDGTYRHPFSTHPRMDVYLTASSPHPLPEFGCTSCHDGQGSATSFTNASHTPNDPHQAHEWEHQYGWFNNHFWEYPMQPARMRESACIKCHHSVVELGVNQKFGATAPKAFAGYQLIKKYGCFGCHEINGYDAGKPIGPDLRLEPQTADEAKKIAEDPKAVAGTERKVGPSLRHVASKTTKEWLTHWTEEPKRFRPTTIMPQFFNLTNNSDVHGQKFSKIELAALAHFMFDKSEPLKLDTPGDYKPDEKRGELFFAQKGCLACHSHDADRFKGSQADFGPNLSKVAAKIKPGADGFNWLYTWIREPERHHKRTRMPDLFIDPFKQGDVTIDPAADIAAYLLKDGPQKYEAIDVTDEQLDELVQLLLTRRKTITPAQARLVVSGEDVNGNGMLDPGEDINGNEVLDGATRGYLKARVGDKTFDGVGKDEQKYAAAVDVVKGDEIELIPSTPGVELSDEEWRNRKMNYLGRVTISRYGCYGCHDIPKFENARPIGTALQDWGLKDPSRLAPEHIEEFLHHHGEPDGSSTRARVEKAIKSAKSDDFDNHEQEEQELGAAFFYESLAHHGRAGFIWQKLRDPRSYDYEKIDTKFYDERLRMPKFPLNEKEIESISTFVLGLVARPPAEKYQYRPKGAELAKVEGEKLLQKFNCTGCHMVDLPEVTQWMATKEYAPGFSELLLPIVTAKGQPEPTVKEKREQQIDQLLAFVKRTVEMADNVKGLKQLVSVRGIAPERVAFISADDAAISSNSAEEWSRTVDRLNLLAKEIGQAKDSNKVTMLEGTAFQPLWTEAENETQQVKRFAALLKELSNLRDQADAKEFSEQRLKFYADYANSLAGVLEQLVFMDWTPGDHLAALGELASMKPHRKSLMKETRDFKSGDVIEKQRLMTFRGTVSSRPAPDDEPEEAEYGYDLWESLDLQTKMLNPGARMLVPAARLVSEKPARGGRFAEWLVGDLMKLSPDNNRFLSMQMSPPSLYLEGLKVQTPWLHSFLKNPYQIRHTTVMRMPKFNMSDAEVQTLANYFAAYDGAKFPYQDIEERQSPYLAGKDKEFDKSAGGYLQESWKVVGAPICSKCHAVGGREYKSTDPKKDIRGPNLDHVANRLRPDWMMLWLYKPSFITPYTSMPVNYPPNQKQLPDLLGGDGKTQTIAIRDALLNYHRLMEREGRLPELPAGALAPAADAKPADAEKK